MKTVECTDRCCNCTREYQEIAWGLGVNPKSPTPNQCNRCVSTFNKIEKAYLAQLQAERRDRPKTLLLQLSS